MKIIRKISAGWRGFCKPDMVAKSWDNKGAALTHLSPKALKSFQDRLNPGQIVEAYVTEDGEFHVRNYPKNELDLSFIPFMVNLDRDVIVRLTAILGPGEKPVGLVDVKVPAGVTLTGLKGAK